MMLTGMMVQINEKVIKLMFPSQMENGFINATKLFFNVQTRYLSNVPEPVLEEYI